MRLAVSSFLAFRAAAACTYACMFVSIFVRECCVHEYSYAYMCRCMSISTNAAVCVKAVHVLVRTCV
jgi:hypothetical protein